MQRLSEIAYFGFRDLNLNVHEVFAYGYFSKEE
jgi:hypothetical protein